MKTNNNQYHKNFLEVLPSKVPSLGVFIKSTPDRERHRKTVVLEDVHATDYAANIR